MGWEPVVIAIVKTLGRVFTGFLLACLTAGLVQVLFVETPKELAALPNTELATQAGTTLELILLAATHFAIFSAAFALIAAGIAEWLGLRSPGYWLAAGIGIALLGFCAQYASEIAGQPSILNNYALQAYLTAGFFAGLVYWMVSGMHSGSARTQPAADATARPRLIVDDAPADPVKKGSLAEKLAMKRQAKDPGPANPAAPAASISPAPAPGRGPAPAAGRAPLPAPAKDKDAAKSQQPASTTAVPVTKPDPSAKANKAPEPQSNPSVKAPDPAAKTV